MLSPEDLAILDYGSGAELFPGDPDEFADWEYLVGDQQGIPKARVRITPIARIQGNKQYTQVVISSPLPEANGIRQNTEVFVTPPLLSEEQQRQAALRAVYDLAHAATAATLKQLI